MGTYGKDGAGRHPKIDVRDYPATLGIPTRHRLSVVGCLQWGSTGKGNVVARLTEDSPSSMTTVGVRVGGPNAGHTFRWGDGRTAAVQSIPVPLFVDPLTVGVIGAAGLIHREIFVQEWHALCAMREILGWPRPTLIVDRQATIITGEHMLLEGELKERISSTGEGVGAATAERVMRRAPVIEEDRDFCAWLGAEGVALADTVSWLNVALLRGLPGVASRQEYHVIAEGTQGALLSLYTGGYYPYCTSRECTPDALLSQMGLTSRHARRVDIYGVMRTFPIRVGGPSGPLPHEISWDELERRTDGYVHTPERTTVTKKIRRIAELDFDIMRRVVAQTRPTSLVLTFLDYQVPGIAGSNPDPEKWHGPAGAKARRFIDLVEEELGVRVSYVGTGPIQDHYLPTESVR